MVIGNGMIANSFKSYSANSEFVIFASGVSNSKESETVNFEREFNLLKKIVNDNPLKTLVYFSTCSIIDNELTLSPYVIHKKKTEEYISKNISSYIIFRVSNLAGISNNPYTLLNNFISNILANRPIILWKNAYRNIIDIDDMFVITDRVLKKKVSVNTIINIANPENYSVPFIVKTIEGHLGKKALISELNKGSNYQINTSFILPIIHQKKIMFDADYLDRMLKKYYHSR